MFSKFTSRPVFARKGVSPRLRRNWRRLVMVLTVLLFATFFATALQSADAISFSSPYFQRTWQRADYPVAIGAVQRGFTWGPAPFYDTFESYGDSPNGQRRVEYFDKARMEISRPDLLPTSDYYVTNGLIVKEMVTGLLQTGDNQFQQRFPAYDVPVAGDPTGANQDAVTYASFYALNAFYNTGPATAPGTPVYPGSTPLFNGVGVLERQPDRTNERADETIVKGGSVGRNDLLGALDGVNYVYYDSTLGHNIPQIFWNFLNQSGPTFNGSSLVNGPVFNWVSTMGYPITDAYWTRTSVAGVTRDVLVQLYERRILTYTPTNPDPYKVEMGNVGRHYYAWRYNPNYDLKIPLQSNTEVKPEAGFPGTSFAIRAFRFVQNETIFATLISPDGRPTAGTTIIDAPAGQTFFSYIVQTSGVTKPGLYTLYLKGQYSGNEAKAYFFVLGVPGFNLPPQ